jgi:hypothetical protein
MARLPAPCCALVMCKRSRVRGRRSFRGLAGGTHCALQDHPLARCQRGASPRGLRRVAATRRGPLAAPGISYRFCSRK